MLKQLNVLSNGFILLCFQKNIYSACVKYWQKIFEEGLNNRETVKHLSVITALKKICNHPILISKQNIGENNEEVCFKTDLLQFKHCTISYFQS